MLTTERSSDGREARLEKQLVIALIIGLGAIVLAGFLIYSPRSTFDSQSALNWARDIWEGNLPNFGSYRAPTQHPLMLALGLLFQPAGDYGPQLMVLWSLIGYVALLIAAFRFGVLISGIFGGIVALGLLATRLDVAWLAGVGFLDPPYAALILWAAFLEARSPRRGGIVWVLLTMAGLLRPEAWLLTGMYMLWVGYPLEW